MKKWTAVILILSVLFLTACNRNGTEGSGGGTDALSDDSGGFLLLDETEPFGHDSYDWEKQLLSDAFDAGTPIGDAGRAAVTLEVTAVTDSELTVTVTAPNIAAELLDWYAGADAQNDFEAVLEQKIIALMEGETVTGSYTMGYTDVSGVPSIHYTQEYANAVSCGLLEFYSVLQNNIINQMGGSADD